MTRILKLLNFLIPLFILIFAPQAALGQQSNRYLITAASSGLGVATCETLASEGHSLILAGRDETKLKELQSKLKKTHKGEYSIELFDYSDLSSLQKLGDRLKNTPINGVVIIPPRVQISATEIPTSDEWLNLFKLGFVAPLEIIKATVPVLKSEGSIVIISGLTSVHYLPSYKNSNVLRNMWVAEMKNLVYQLGDRKIRTNCISPGVVLTEYNENKLQERASKNNKTVKEQLDEETKEIPLHRHGQPKDVAEAISFLLSEKAIQIDGVNLVIDGGLSKSY